MDVLVANAALPASGRVEDFEPDQIDRALDVNLRAPIQLTRALLPGMLERAAGTWCSCRRCPARSASPRSGIYSATKFGLRGFAAGLREDVEPRGIGVTVVFPGFVSEAGLFADSGVRLPPWVRTRTPDQVAAAVLRGIERERAEIDVAPLGLRVGTRVAGLAPVMVARLQRRLGSERHRRRPRRGPARQAMSRCRGHETWFVDQPPMDWSFTFEAATLALRCWRSW